MLDEIERGMAQGVPYRELVAACKGKWGVGHATVGRYCASIRKRWQQEEEELRPARRVELRALLMDAWGVARKGKQGMALAALARVLAKFDGLEAPTQVQVAICGQIDVRAMTPSERRAEISNRS